MSQSRPPLLPRRRVASASEPVPPPDTNAILQAAQRLSHISKQDQNSAARPGHKRRRTASPCDGSLADPQNKGNSKIIIIGPFPSQVLDLSSSESESSFSGRRLSFSSDIVIPSPPVTPTQIGGNDIPLLDSRPSSSTDWIAYSTPLDGDEDMEVEEGTTSFGTPSSSMRSATSVYGQPEPLVLVPDDRKSTPEVDHNFTQMLLQSLRIDPSGPPRHSRMPKQPRQHYHNHGNTNRIIPIPFNAAWLRPSTPVQPMPRPGFTPTYSVQPIPIERLNFSSSSRTLVDEDDDSDPQRPAMQVSAEAELFSDSKLVCCACDGRDLRMFLLKPCGDLVCPTCFSSSIAAVSVTQGASKCPACIDPVASFEPYKPGQIIAVRGPRPKKIEPSIDNNGSYENTGQTIVMRIDNVAWDVEPSLVERFLPPGTLPLGHPQPIHICMDRRDGRTKDYMYIEVASQAAARKVLQTRQNAFMPGGRITGGRKRAVTISQVTHKELLSELRPNSRQELDSLLELCEAALTTPAPQLRIDANGRGRLHASVGVNGKVHYLKYRHAPFHALISLMCKMSGTESPVYWDLFRIASGEVFHSLRMLMTGAISALANSLKYPRVHSGSDRALLKRLNELFDKCFSTRPKA